MLMSRPDESVSESEPDSRTALRKAAGLLPLDLRRRTG